MNWGLRQAPRWRRRMLQRTRPHPQNPVHRQRQVEMYHLRRQQVRLGQTSRCSPVGRSGWEVEQVLRWCLGRWWLCCDDRFDDFVCNCIGGVLIYPSHRHWVLEQGSGVFLFLRNADSRRWHNERECDDRTSQSEFRLHRGRILRIVLDWES